MKISRTELIEILKKRLQEAEQQRAQRHTIAMNEFHAAGRRYYEDTSNAWLSFAATIKTKVERGAFITTDDVPNEIKYSAHSDTLRLFTKKNPTPPSPTETEQQLARLIELLESSTDDSVSTYSLEKLGFPIGRVLR